jgi:hypothetical protein
MVEDLLEYVYRVRLAVTILNSTWKVREQIEEILVFYFFDTWEFHYNLVDEVEGL